MRSGLRRRRPGSGGGPRSGAGLASGVSGAAGEARGRARAGARAVPRAHRRGLPATRRCTSGYNLRELLAPAPNLGRLLAGSEGTLALFTELEVLLDARPARRVGAALTFPTLRAALEANLAILETGPSAVELLDLAPLRRAPNIATFQRMAALLDGDDSAMLTVEYQGSEEEALAGLARLRALAGELGAHREAWLEAPEDLAEAAALRRAALPLLMGAPGAERPAAFVEDMAVAPERLAAFVADLQRIVAAHGTRASFTGHASAGCLHLRPMIDLKTAAGVARMDVLAAEIGRLVADYHGAISGEHGCGRSRSWFLPQLLGPGLYQAMVAVKDAFDPRRLLNPGVVVDGPGVTESLRFGADYRGGHGWTPRLSYTAEGGFDLAVEKCFGAGLCKKSSGTMCPPGAATRDEARSTRARANALQGVVCGAVPLAAIGERRVPRGARHLRRLQGVQDGVPGRRRHGGAQGGVARGGPRARGRAGARARHRRLSPPGRPRGAGGSAGQPARTHPGGARRHRSRRRGPRAAPAGVRAPAAHPAPGRRRRGLRRTGRRGRRHHRGPHRRPVRRLLHPVPGAGHRRGAGPAARGRRRAAHARRRGLLRPHRTVHGPDREGARHGAARAQRAATRLWPPATTCSSSSRVPLDAARRLDPSATRGGPCRRGGGRERPALALVADLAAEGRLHFRAGGRVLLHSHCHEKALGFAAATRAALGCVPGLEVEEPDAGCCGMSGVFGYEADHYALSAAMAERALLPAVRAAAAETAVLATGTSCGSQIGDLAGRPAVHPLEFLAGRLQS